MTCRPLRVTTPAPPARAIQLRSPAASPGEETAPKGHIQERGTLYYISEMFWPTSACTNSRAMGMRSSLLFTHHCPHQSPVPPPTVRFTV